ncbi:CsbD family protein [Saccharomonospora piscinae]|uniref:CsbD family protein n=1 Tax=Saccharomonospora piscinae TaxID=687388 RepID=A0A1V9A195_SACPI|nr:CsbD family protein [Saccharomonospora piscinae]OQO90714.1 CsbD family protein [Saccharomonospora piscinae]TLW93955.1 CsbD family protein [Saccharomonospora piscinae]
MTGGDERQEGIKGAVEDMKGRVKEAAGTFLGNDEMEREGSAQQDKARAQQEAAEKQEQAKQAQQDASEAEARERSQQ